MTDTPLTDKQRNEWNDTWARWAKGRIQELEANLAAAEKQQFKAVGCVNKRDGCTFTSYENLPEGKRMLYIAIDKAMEDD